MFRKFKSGYFHNNNIKYNRYEFSKTKMIKMELDEDEKMKKTSSKNIYNFAVSNATKKMLAHRNNSYKLTDDDYYSNDYNDYQDYQDY